MDQSFFTGRISQLGTRVEPEQSKQSESKDETQQSHQSHSGVGQGPAGMASDSSFSLCLLQKKILIRFEGSDSDNLMIIDWIKLAD